VDNYSFKVKTGAEEASGSGAPDDGSGQTARQTFRFKSELNRHPELFRFAGAIHMSRDAKDGGISLKKVAADVGGEIEENFQHAGKKITGLFHHKKK
jgi:hypothetical protein